MQEHDSEDDAEEEDDEEEVSVSLDTEAYSKCLAAIETRQKCA
jgi:hypothetical protein